MADGIPETPHSVGIHPMLRCLNIIDYYNNHPAQITTEIQQEICGMRNYLLTEYQANIESEAPSNIDVMYFQRLSQVSIGIGNAVEPLPLAEENI